MPHFRFVLAYDGTDFVGWQRQALGASIQGALEAALSDLDGDPVAVVGAGRTDAGVHALGQVAAATLKRPIPAASVVRALNVRLPETVRVLNAEAVPSGFHPQFDARSKTYRYRIWNADVLNPFERRYAWHVIGALDVAAMEAAARLLEGRHDFAAFQASGSDVKTTVRTVFSSLVLSLSKDEPVITYDITGDGFLRHMVRTIVGSLVDVGRGRRPPPWLAGVLESRDRRAAGPTAPPEGLFLMRIDYPSGSLAGER